MRILIWSFVGRTPDSAYWHWLKTGMEAVGHQVIAVDAFALAEVFGPRCTEAILLSYARAYRVQAALVLPQNLVGTDFLQALRQQGVAVIGFRYDDGHVAAEGMPAPLQAQLAAFTLTDGSCDLTVTICRSAGPVLAAAGLLPPTYVPLAYGWQTVDPADRPRRRVIAFAGSPKYNTHGPCSARVTLVRALLAAGLPVELHNDAWSEVPGCETAARPTPALADFHAVFRTATVNLVIASDWSPLIHPMMKLLHLEIASTGAMQLTNRCSELDDYFTSGRDIAYAKSEADYVTQARYYLDHPDEAHQLGRNSRRTVERLAGWECWWSSVADLLARRGLPLDLMAPALPPDPAEVPLLGMAVTAVARAYERAGHLVLAHVYWEEALGIDPADKSAQVGVSRLSASPATS